MIFENKVKHDEKNSFCIANFDICSWPASLLQQKHLSGLCFCSRYGTGRK